MVTPKRGPLKIDLTGIEGTRKIDAEFCPFSNRYRVRIGKRRYVWTATEFADNFPKWLLRQKDAK